jgi:hypothetical protein
MPIVIGERIARESRSVSTTTPAFASAKIGTTP